MGVEFLFFRVKRVIEINCNNVFTLSMYLISPVHLNGEDGKCMLCLFYHVKKDCGAVG